MLLYYLLLPFVTAQCPATCPVLAGVCQAPDHTLKLIPQGGDPNHPCCKSFSCTKPCAEYCTDEQELYQTCTSPNTIGKISTDSCGCNHCLNGQNKQVNLPYCKLNTIVCLTIAQQVSQCPAGMVLELVIPRDPLGFQPCCDEYHCVKPNSCYQSCGHKGIGQDCHCDGDCPMRGDCCEDMKTNCLIFVNDLIGKGIWPTMQPTSAPTYEPYEPDPPPNNNNGGGGMGGGGNGGNGGNGVDPGYDIVAVAEEQQAQNKVVYSNYLVPVDCDFACGSQAVSGCWCDEHCFGNKDCCFNFASVCPDWKMPPPGTPRTAKYAPPPAQNIGPPDFSHLYSACAGLCGMKSSTSNGMACYCDDKCHVNYDCCPDKVEHCGQGTGSTAVVASQPGAWGSNSISAFSIAAAMVTEPAFVPGWMFGQPVYSNKNGYQQQSFHFKQGSINKDPSGLTCQGRCGYWSVAREDSSRICFCDQQCTTIGDCCTDYAITCT